MKQQSLLFFSALVHTIVGTIPVFSNHGKLNAISQRNSRRLDLKQSQRRNR